MDMLLHLLEATIYAMFLSFKALLHALLVTECCSAHLFFLVTESQIPEDAGFWSV